MEFVIVIMVLCFLFGKYGGRSVRVTRKDPDTKPPLNRLCARGVQPKKPSEHPLGPPPPPPPIPLKPTKFGW